VAEAGISFLMMSMVLTVSGKPGIARYAGLGAGLLVATFITFEAPLSGMSMNPARSLGSNLLAGAGDTMWVYFAAPLVGMLAAAERIAWGARGASVPCAKLYHTTDVRCIFCGHEPPGHLRVNPETSFTASMP
jgi:aquaporin Z